MSTTQSAAAANNVLSSISDSSKSLSLMRSLFGYSLFFHLPFYYVEQLGPLFISFLSSPPTEGIHHNKAEPGSDLANKNPSP